MNKTISLLIGLTIFNLSFSTEAIAGKPAKTIGTTLNQERISVRDIQRGMASWYGPGFHGNRCANGEIYNQYGLSAAHRTLPFGTRVRVTNLNNHRSVVVRINDRGPFIRGRIIDLSKGAAREIGMISSGVAPVTVEILR